MIDRDRGTKRDNKQQEEGMRRRRGGGGDVDAASTPDVAPLESRISRHVWNAPRDLAAPYATASSSKAA